MEVRAMMSKVWICLAVREASGVSRLRWGDRREVQTGRREGAECTKQEERRLCMVETQLGEQPDRKRER